MNSVQTRSITLRPITDDDMNFLYNVYRSTRIDEPGISDWPKHEKEQFILDQFTMQHAQYMVNYNEADFMKIIVDNKEVGRLYIHRQVDDIRLVDIALLKQYRNKGIGTKLIHDLVEESDKTHVPLSLHVEYYNRVISLYERLGFKKEGESGVYHYMRRLPTSGEHH